MIVFIANAFLSGISYFVHPHPTIYVSLSLALSVFLSLSLCGLVICCNARVACIAFLSTNNSARINHINTKFVSLDIVFFYCNLKSALRRHHEITPKKPNRPIDQNPKLNPSPNMYQPSRLILPFKLNSLHSLIHLMYISNVLLIIFALRPPKWVDPPGKPSKLKNHRYRAPVVVVVVVVPTLQPFPKTSNPTLTIPCSLFCPPEI